MRSMRKWIVCLATFALILSGLRAHASNEIQAAGTPNKTCYAIVIAASGASPGQFYNALTTSFEAFNAADWVATKYPIATSEVGGANTTGLYFGNLPALAAGRYSVLVYQEAIAGTVSLTFDTRIASGNIDWTGTLVTSLGVSIPAVASGANGGLPTVNGSNLIAGIVGNTVQTGDAYAWVHTALPNVAAGANGGLPTVNGSNFIAGIVGDTPQTGDAFARLGAPSGASLAADTAAIKASVGTPLQAGNVTVGGYASNQDPATLLFNSTLLQSVNNWTVGTLGYWWERALGIDAGNYNRVPSTNLTQFTLPNGTTVTATVSVDSQGRITGRVIPQ